MVVKLRCYLLRWFINSLYLLTFVVINLWACMLLSARSTRYTVFGMKIICLSLYNVHDQIGDCPVWFISSVSDSCVLINRVLQFIIDVGSSMTRNRKKPSLLEHVKRARLTVNETRQVAHRRGTNTSMKTMKTLISSDLRPQVVPMLLACAMSPISGLAMMARQM